MTARAALLLVIVSVCVLAPAWAAPDAQSQPAPPAARRVEAKDVGGKGKPDTWIAFEGRRSVKLWRSRNSDGTIDVWGTYKYPSATEKRFEVGVDRNHDGKLDYWRLDLNGQPTREWGDLNFDGKVDTWVFYAAGHKEWAVFDKNFDGKPDACFHYASDGLKIDAGEIDERFEGKPSKTFGQLPKERPTVGGTDPPWPAPSPDEAVPPPVTPVADKATAPIAPSAK